jgi:beta-lactamase regulating signal transducer with metallopeptidase domain
MQIRMSQRPRTGALRNAFLFLIKSTCTLIRTINTKAVTSTIQSGKGRSLFADRTTFPTLPAKP